MAMLSVHVVMPQPEEMDIETAAVDLLIHTLKCQRQHRLAAARED